MPRTSSSRCSQAGHQPIRAEIVRRQVETGETSVEHDGWVSTPSKEKMSAALIERQYGHLKGELPRDVVVETMELKLSEELAPLAGRAGPRI